MKLTVGTLDSCAVAQDIRMTKKYKVLTNEQVQFFMDNGYVTIPQAFTKTKAEEFTKDMWIRLGMDPEDKSTWTREWTNLPSHKHETVSTFAPKAWDAICDLVGGEDRIHPEKRSWSDGLIVNLGSDEFTPDNLTRPRDLTRWHCDGDFFLHFLDSPEQGLLVVPLFADIVDHAGGTMIAPQGIGHIARYLAAHPEGVMPTAFPFLDIALKECDQYAELTGKLGDVVLLHPFMLHSASRNHLRIPRIISNPPVALVEPFQYSRPSVDDYSLVELKTLRELGVDPMTNGGKGYDFKLVGERKEVVPARIAIQAKWKAEAMERMEKAKAQEKIQPKMSLDEVWDAIGY